ncbi:MAG: corrinoid protein [Opitutaceae bacterium]|nr:corrinoid protein [Opitutaceae bacterium]
MTTLERLRIAVESGKRQEAKALTQELLQEGNPPLRIVDLALVPAMGAVGERFKTNQIFVPEMLVAARAMKEAMGVLEPLLAEAGIKPKHQVVIGTVQGDLHDIGKNLVAMMLKGANFGIIDLGVNVPPERFVEAARQEDVHIVALSALLTTTMPAMRTAVETLRREVRADIKIIVGGAPITGDYAREIGADGYSADAASAVDLARSLVGA